MSDDGSKERGDLDRSTVVELLLAQYRGVRLERLVVATTVRIFWLVLLLAVLFVQSKAFGDFVAFFFVGFTLFMFSMSVSLRIRHNETVIRDSLVRLDRDLEDYYIKTLTEWRGRISVLGPGRLVYKYEEMVWLTTYLMVLCIRLLNVTIAS